MFGVVPRAPARRRRASVRPPFRLDWVAGGTSLVEFPPAVAFHNLYYATLAGNLIGRLDEERPPPVDRPRRPLRGSRSRPSSRLGRGSVFETFLNRHAVRAGTLRRGETAESSRSPPVRIPPSAGAQAPRRDRDVADSSSASGSTSATANGNVYCLATVDGKTLWTFHAGGAVKGAIAYDRGKVFFGAYDGRLYALRATDGKLLWRAESNRDLFGGHGHVLLDACRRLLPRLPRLDRRPRLLVRGAQRQAALGHGTGGFVYGSPAVWRHRVFVGSYDHTFYAFDAATGDVLWKFRANGPISGSATVVDGVVYFAHPQPAARTASTRAPGKSCGRIRTALHAGRDRRHRLYVVGWGKVYAIRPQEVASWEIWVIDPRMATQEEIQLDLYGSGDVGGRSSAGSPRRPQRGRRLVASPRPLAPAGRGARDGSRRAQPR